MSTTYFLRDKNITEEKLCKLEELEKNINQKLVELYNNANKEIKEILPIDDKSLIPECRQYEPEYEPSKFWINEIRDYEIAIKIKEEFRFINFRNKEEFMNFYKQNSEKYNIVDEYNQIFSLEEFLKIIN